MKHARSGASIVVAAVLSSGCAHPAPAPTAEILAGVDERNQARADGAFQAVWSGSRGGHFQLRTARIVVGD